MKKLKAVALVIALFGIFSVSAQTEVKEVTDKELKNFVTAAQQAQLKNQQLQMEMMQMIKDSGLTMQEFENIRKAKMSPQTEATVSAEKMKSYEAVNARLEEMQPQLQQKMEEIVEGNGLTMQRYQEVASAIENDKELQMKLQKMMGQAQQAPAQGQ